MQEPFATTFSLGPLFTWIGVLFLATAILIAASRFQSWLLRISALSLFVCAFSGAAYWAMPIQLSINGSTSSIWPPHWVSWLAFVGAPFAIFVAGAAALVFFLRLGRRGSA